MFAVLGDKPLRNYLIHSLAFFWRIAGHRGYTLWQGLASHHYHLKKGSQYG